ncbi:MAG: hypothetical protein AAGC85_16630 [Bacteroidota bacterium]
MSGFKKLHDTEKLAIEQSVEYPGSRYTYELSYLRLSFVQTNKYRNSILAAAELAPENLSKLYPFDYNSLAEELKLVVRLIAMGKYEVPLEGHQLSSGNYYLRMQVGPYQQVKLI